MLLLRKPPRKVETIVSYYFEIYNKKLNIFPNNTRAISTSSVSRGNVNKKDFDYDEFRAEYARNPNVKGAFTFLRGEFGKYCEEFRERFPLNSREFEQRYPNQIDMLYTFDKEKSLRNFIVTTDSTHDEGYSSASLKLTQDKTALFSGYIDTNVPKTGNVKVAGYANLTSRKKVLSFGRPGKHDWTFYTHLVLKIRGDGRTYAIILPTPGSYDLDKGVQFCYPLYTRGGPYWQLTRIPFNHFFFALQGKASDAQAGTVPLNKITNFGITLSDGIDGPFKLEIDYVGLQNVPNHRNICPYEQYNVGKAIAT